MRGYIRERAKGPSVDEQRKALAAAGVPTDGDHPPIYIDVTPRRTRKDLDDPLPQRRAAIHSMRPGDKLVVYDAATLGPTEGEILNAIAAIGEREDVTLVICNPAGEHRWHSDVTEMAGVVADGGKVLARERQRVRSGINPIMGRPKLLTGDAMALARQLWGQRSMSSRMVAAEVERQTGVSVGIRTLLNDLGHKTLAVEKAERILRRPKPVEAKMQPKPKRRKPARKTSK